MTHNKKRFTLRQLDMNWRPRHNRNFSRVSYGSGSQRKRFSVLVSAGVLLLVTALTTAAVFRDNAFLGVGDVITSKPFSIGLVAHNDKVFQVGEDSTSYTFAGTDFLPGATQKISIRVFNNSPETKASLSVSLASVAGVARDVSDFVRVSASVGGSPVIGVPSSPSTSLQQAPVKASNVVTLESRGAPALSVGNAWIAGPNAQSSTVVDVWLHFKDDLTTAQKTSLNGGGAKFTLTIAGTSVGA